MLQQSYSRLPPARPGSARTRFQLALSDISTIRTTGSGWGNEEAALRRHGFEGWGDFFGAALHAPMPIGDFAYLLGILQQDPAAVADEVRGRALSPEFLINVELRRMRERGEPCFHESPGGTIFVRPREAAEGMLADPLARDYVPASLVAYLRGGADGPPELGELPQLPPRSASGAAATVGAEARAERHLRQLATRYEEGAGPRPVRAKWEPEGGLGTRARARVWAKVASDHRWLSSPGRPKRDG
jgi:hypothetical protein